MHVARLCAYNLCGMLYVCVCISEYVYTCSMHIQSYSYTTSTIQHIMITCISLFIYVYLLIFTKGNETTVQHFESTEKTVFAPHQNHPLGAPLGVPAASHGSPMEIFLCGWWTDPSYKVAILGGWIWGLRIPKESKTCNYNQPSNPHINNGQIVSMLALFRGWTKPSGSR